MLGYFERDLGATVNLTCMIGSEGLVRLPIYFHTFDTAVAMHVMKLDIFVSWVPVYC